MKTWAWVSGAIVAAGTTFLFMARGREETKTRDEGSEHVELEELRDELKRVRREVRAQGSRVGTAMAQLREQEASKPEVAREAPASDGAPELTRPTPPRSLDHAEMLGGLGSHFEHEAVDHAWMREATPVADAEVQRFLPKDSHMASVECRESMCRAQTVHKDLATFRQFMDGMLTASERKWSGAMMTSVVDTAATGQVQAVVYMARGDDLVALATAED